MPTVSVIVPNYNYSRYLRQRLDSILAQTFSDFELILLDDASTDDSRALMDSYADPRITQRIYNTHNSGSAFMQWKRGIEAAQGEYIWIAEADDYADPTLLETLMTALQQSIVKNQKSNVVFAFCGSQQVDAQGQNLTADWNHYRDQKNHYFAGEEFMKQWLSFRNRVYNASAVVFRRDVALQCIGSATQMRYAGDWLFWAMMTQYGSVAEIRQEQNFFRMHAQKVTAESSRRTNEWLQELNSIYAFLLNSPIYSPQQQTVLKGHLIYRILRAPNQSYRDKKNSLQQCSKLFNLSTLQRIGALVRFFLCKTGIHTHGLNYRF